MNAFSHPILSCADSVDWESQRLADEPAVWDAMKQVGCQLAQGIRQAYAMTGYPQRGLSVLGLIGKGHNGGDALLAIGELARQEGCLGRVTLLLATPLGELKPHVKRAFDLLEGTLDMEVRCLPSAAALETAARDPFDLCLDGLLGMQFRPPLREGVGSLIAAVNASSKMRMRVAVDLPSGAGGEGAFRADFTFATGIYKRALLGAGTAGVVRYLDIGFFAENVPAVERVLVDSILDPLRSLRPASSEKRQYGHLAILAGSRSMPGALAMAVRSALQSGVGLVTVFAPESVVSQLACQLPEAMWRTWPETPEGGLALEGLWQIKSIAEKATCLLLGPGMGSEAETQALLVEVGRIWRKPAVLDADALRPEVVAAFRDSENPALVLTPHDGEFKRLTGSDECSDTAVRAYAKAQGLTLVKKGANTRVSDGELLCVNTSGNPVLSRGGSGDLLAGLLGGLLAQYPTEVLESACRAVYWHGKAADQLALAKGQTAVRTTDVLDFLSPALQCSEVWNSNFPVSRPFGP